MALPLGKLTFIVGAGLVGSVLAKESRSTSFSDIVSGALKVVLKPLRRDDSSVSSSKPKDAILMQQINSLRDELQILASSNRCLTIVAENRSGAGKYGAVVIVIVVGYGYIWWKGWKITDMMFATRRGLNDACTSVAKQLETLYSSIAATKKHLSARISSVDTKVDECLDNTSATREEVSVVRGDLKQIGADVQSVQYVVRSLETKICRIENRQNETNVGVHKLVAFTKNLIDNGTVEQIEGASLSSSRPAIDLPQETPSRALSLPSSSSTEPPSPTLNTHQRSQSAAIYTSFASGLKGISENTTQSPDPITELSERSSTDDRSGGAGVLGRTFSGIRASFVTRSRSVLK